MFFEEGGNLKLGGEELRGHQMSQNLVYFGGLVMQMMQGF